ncbi:MAG: hypothetical protein HY055_10115 [Magnetospirillum sp.]|nr:hypothetical protein [Magnetospirillum sp.]
MALSTKQVGAAAATGVAAATARIGSGGRNVASSTRPDVERTDYAHQVGLNEENMLRFQQDGQLNPDGRRQQREDRGFTPLLARTMFGFGAASLDENNDNSQDTPFLNEVMRGVGSYEQNIRVTSPSTVKPGSVMNYLF